MELLPPEIIFHFFENLWLEEPTSFTNLGQTCNYLRECRKSSLEILRKRYRYEIITVILKKEINKEIKKIKHTIINETLSKRIHGEHKCQYNIRNQKYFDAHSSKKLKIISAPSLHMESLFCGLRYTKRPRFPVDYQISLHCYYGFDFNARVHIKVEFNSTITIMKYKVH